MVLLNKILYGRNENTTVEVRYNL